MIAPKNLFANLSLFMIIFIFMGDRTYKKSTSIKISQSQYQIVAGGTTTTTTTTTMIVVVVVVVVVEVVAHYQLLAIYYIYTSLYYIL